MFGRFFGRHHMQDSNDAFESASCCASFFAALLLLIDTVIAVSIFVCADNLLAVLVSVLVCVLLARDLLKGSRPIRSKPLAASI